MKYKFPEHYEVETCSYGMGKDLRYVEIETEIYQ